MTIVGKANDCAAILPRMASTGGRPKLSDEEAEHMRAVLARRRDTVHGGNQAALARELGIKPPSLHATMQGHNTMSYPTLLRLAELEGITVPEVLGRPAPQAPVDDERFAGLPNLRALMLTTDWRDAGDDARARVLDEANRSGGDLSIGDWAAELKSAIRRHPGTSSRTRDAFGREVGEEDVVEDDEGA